MKDIEKMRREMEEKIRRAELSNEIEMQTGLECTVMGESPTQPGKTWLSFGNLDRENAAKLLSLYPQTEPCRTRGHKDKDIIIAYVLRTERSPKMPYNVMEVEWIHEDKFITFKINLDTQDEELKEHFTRTTYNINDEFAGLYYGANAHKDLYTQPVLTFKGGDVIRFYGGHFTQLDEKEVMTIIGILKNDNGNSNEN